MAFRKAPSEVFTITVWFELHVAEALVTAKFFQLCSPSTRAGKHEAKLRALSESADSSCDRVGLVRKAQIPGIVNRERAIRKRSWPNLIAVRPVFDDVYFGWRYATCDESRFHVLTEGNDRVGASA